MHSLGQARVRVCIAVGTTDWHVVRSAVARQSGMPVTRHGVDGRGFTVFFSASDLAREAVASVTIHLERGSVVCNNKQFITATVAMFNIKIIIKCTQYTGTTG